MRGKISPPILSVRKSFPKKWKIFSHYTSFYFGNNTLNYCNYYINKDGIHLACITLKHDILHCKQLNFYVTSQGKNVRRDRPLKVRLIFL
jgi:hypothetical protein